MTLWTTDGGIGRPAFSAEVAPFHPLVVLARAIGGSRWEVVASILLALLLGILTYALLRSRPRLLSLTAAIAAVVLSLLLPLHVALPIGGAFVAAAFIVAVMRRPSRGPWILAVLATALAILGTTSAFPWWLAIAIIPMLNGVAPGRDPSRAPAVAMAAVIAAIGLTAFWWMPALEVGAHHPPPSNVVPLSFAGDFEPDHVPGEIQRRANSEKPPHGPRGFEVVSRGRGRLTIDVRDGAAWGLASLGEPWWPGWRVYWNGERLPPVRVGGTTVGSFVPPGEGTLALRYRPDSFDAGLRWTAVALLLVVASFAWPWFLRIPRLPAFSMQRLGRVLPLVALAGYAGFLIQHRVTAAGGSDSSGYLNGARLWRLGTPVVPVDPPPALASLPGLTDKFIPLGFAPGPETGTMAPTYPAGLPFHFVLATLVGGDDAKWLVAPVFSTIGVVLMALLARQVGLSWPLAVSGAAVLALFPSFVMFAIMAMSDSVATAWTLATMLLAFRAGSERARAVAWAAACGAVFGFSVIIRPTQVLLVPALVVAMGIRIRTLAAFAAAAAPFAAVQMALAWRFWGSPFRTGYGSIEPLLAWANVPERLRNYSLWLAQLATPLVFPLGFVGLASDAPRRTRLVLASWFVPFFVFYCFYRPADTWWYTRFLLPALPALILLALFALRAVLARLPGSSRAPLAIVLVASVLATETWQVARYDAHLMGRGETEYPRAVAAAAAVVPADRVVVGMQLSGAYYYYRGETMLRYDFITEDQAWLVLARTTGRGVPLYALVQDWELRNLAEAVPCRWVEIRRVGQTALLECDGEAAVAKRGSAAVEAAAVAPASGRRRYADAGAPSTRSRGAGRGGAS